jgi:hypothetical protein
MLVIEDKEHFPLKGEHSSQTSSSGSQPSSGKGEFPPSIYFKRPRWYELTFMGGSHMIELSPIVIVLEISEDKD